MRGLSAAELLRLPVCLHGIELGRPVAALVDRDADRLIGLEVVCGDQAHRFLPFAVLELRPGEIAIESALTLIDERDLDVYRRGSLHLADIALSEPWIDTDGRIFEALSAA